MKHLQIGWYGNLSGSSSSYSDKVENVLFSTPPSRVLVTTQSPIQWVLEFFPRVQRGRGVNLATHLQLVPRSGKHGHIRPLRARLHGVEHNQLNTEANLSYLAAINHCLNYTDRATAAFRRG
jgi:hypothetical protein